MKNIYINPNMGYKQTEGLFLVEFRGCEAKASKLGLVDGFHQLGVSRGQIGWLEGEVVVKITAVSSISLDRDGQEGRKGGTKEVINEIIFIAVAVGLVPSLPYHLWFEGGFELPSVQEVPVYLPEERMPSDRLLLLQTAQTLAWVPLQQLNHKHALTFKTNNNIIPTQCRISHSKLANLSYLLMSCHVQSALLLQHQASTFNLKTYNSNL